MKRKEPKESGLSSLEGRSKIIQKTGEESRKQEAERKRRAGELRQTVRQFTWHGRLSAILLGYENGILTTADLLESVKEMVDYPRDVEPNVEEERTRLKQFRTVPSQTKMLRNIFVKRPPLLVDCPKHGRQKTLPLVDVDGTMVLRPNWLDDVEDPVKYLRRCGKCIAESRVRR